MVLIGAHESVTEVIRRRQIKARWKSMGRSGAAEGPWHSGCRYCSLADGKHPLSARLAAHLQLALPGGTQHIRCCSRRNSHDRERRLITALRYK